jgi:hypothetical protein
MSETIDHNRRRFYCTSAIAIAATQVGMTGSTIISAASWEQQLSGALLPALVATTDTIVK